MFQILRQWFWTQLWPFAISLLIWPMVSEAQWVGKSHTISKSYTSSNGEKTSIRTDVTIGTQLIASIEESDSTWIATLYSRDGKVEKIFHNLKEFSDLDKKLYPDLYALVSKISSITKESKATSQKYLLKVLVTNSPRGYAVYKALDNKEIFDFFTSSNFTVESSNVNYSELIRALDTGIHESVHALNSEVDQYVLISGKQLSIPSIHTTPDHDWIYGEASAYKNSLLDSYIHTYLTGSSGAQNITVLLDELNAYTHGASVVVDLSEGLKTRANINPGLQSMLVFHGLYLEKLMKSKPSLYAEIQKNPVVYAAFLNLYQQAESTLMRTCRSPFAWSEKQILAIALSDRIVNAWGQFLKKDLATGAKELRKQCQLPLARNEGTACSGDLDSTHVLLELSNELSVQSRRLEKAL